MPASGVQISISYFDSGATVACNAAVGWELYYENLDSADVLAGRFLLEGGNAWKDASVRVPLKTGGQFRISPIAGTASGAAIFHSIEITKPSSSDIIVREFTV